MDIVDKLRLSATTDFWHVDPSKTMTEAIGEIERLRAEVIQLRVELDDLLATQIDPMDVIRDWEERDPSQAA